MIYKEAEERYRNIITNVCRFNEYITVNNKKYFKAKWYLKTICFTKASTFSKEIQVFSLSKKTKTNFQILSFPHNGVKERNEWMMVEFCCAQNKKSFLNMKLFHFYDCVITRISQQRKVLLVSFSSSSVLSSLTEVFVGIRLTEFHPINRCILHIT